MKPQVEEMKESVQKGAYSAVGMPIAAAKAIRARFSDLQTMISETREDLSDDLRREFDQWVEEGERVVDRMMERLRSSGAVEQVREIRAAAEHGLRGGMREVSERVDKVTHLVEPDISLEEISGVGPAYHDRLEAAGVTGVVGYLERTHTERGLHELSEAADIPLDTLQAWRHQADMTQIDGIGDAYQRMLHAVGIGTLPQLAEADASVLADEMAAIEAPGMPDRVPDKDVISHWISEAAKLS